jgi:hypothetical protein
MKLWTSLCAGLLISNAAHGAEFGKIRALQHGPVGDSPQFTDIEKYEGEADVALERAWGKYTLNGDPESKVSSSDLRTTISAGGGWSPTKQFMLTGYIDFTLASDYDEEAKRQSPSSTLDSGGYRHELALFGVFKGSPLILGGGLGVLLIGSETREFTYDDDKFRTEVGSAAMPVLRLFGGIGTKQFDGTIGVRFFAMGEAVAETEDPNKAKQEYDVVRRNPAEIHADARLKFAQASVAASLAYVMTGQASEQIDEFSMRYTGSGTKKERRTGGDRRNTDHMVVGVGGRFDPVKMVGILGGVTWTQASYAKPEYASLEHRNLGGIRIDLGTDVKVQMFRGFFQAGYQLDQSMSYTAKSSDRSATQVDQSQRPPISEGDKVKVSQGMWEVGLGGGVAI